MAALTDISSIEFKIGNGVQTPVIDLHSSGNANNYDVRLIGSGGTATNGQGTLNILASTLTWNGTGLAPLASPAFTGVPLTPTAAAYSNTTQVASTAFATRACTTPVTMVSASGASQTLVFAAQGFNCYDITLNTNCTYSFSGGTVGQWQQCFLVERQPTTGSTVYTGTLPSGVKYAYGTPSQSTVVGQIRALIFGTPDGGVTVLGGI